MLSESEEEDGEEDAEAAEAEELEMKDQPVMERALLQLTKIAGSLVRGKKDGERKGIDQILEYHEGGDSSSSSSSRSKAAAYQKLRSALTDNPGLLVKAIEAAMETDFDVLRNVHTGVAGVSVEAPVLSKHDTLRLDPSWGARFDAAGP